MKNNKNLASTIVTDKIRVSTAAIYYDEWFGERWQIETFIFSTDDTVKTSQVNIYGSETCEENVIESKGSLIEKAIRVHNHISNNLLTKYSANHEHNRS